MLGHPQHLYLILVQYFNLVQKISFINSISKVCDIFLKESSNSCAWLLLSFLLFLVLIQEEFPVLALVQVISVHLQTNIAAGPLSGFSTFFQAIQQSFLKQHQMKEHGKYHTRGSQMEKVLPDLSQMSIQQREKTAIVQLLRTGLTHELGQL